MTVARTDLGPTLRAWRERLAPEVLGVHAEAGRRARGLRRVELAERAGISEDYVNRLEQGRVATPSMQVVAALSRALQLAGPERDHLYRLAGLNTPIDGEVCDDISLGVRRMLGRLGDVAVAVFAADWRLIWWSAGWTALLGDTSAVAPPLRNFAKVAFPVYGSCARISRWPVTSLLDAKEAKVVDDLRRATGRYPSSVRLAALVDELRIGNPHFAQLWAAGTVGVHRTDHKIVDHPHVGPVTVDCDVLTDVEHEQKIVMLTTEPGSADEERLRRALGAPYARNAVSCS
jgi:transcriptional regulator with XRE-family HTH domain